jgi:hypothetical protein
MRRRHKFEVSRARRSLEPCPEEVIAQQQLELQQARSLAAQSRLALDAEIQQRRTLMFEREPTRAERSAWEAWLRQEQSVLNRQRAELHQQVAHHADLTRECELLRQECARRFPYLLLSEKQAQQLGGLVDELEQARQARELQAEHCQQLEADLLAAREVATQRAQAEQTRVSGLEAQLNEARQQAAVLKAELVAVRDLVVQREQGDQSRLSTLEAQLSEARQEVELVLQQLHHQVQEELDHYFCFAKISSNRWPPLRSARLSRSMVPAANCGQLPNP